MVSTLSLKEDLSFSHEGPFFLSQRNTEEQNSQRPTETLSQPITQSVTANVSWKASVFSVCRRPSVGSKRAQKGSVNSVSSVREKTPHDSYWQAYRGNLTFHSPPYKGGEGGGATSSWVRNVRKKALLTLWVLWEKNSPANLIGLISSSGCVIFLTEKHRRTEHTAFHRDIKSTDNTERYS